MARDQESFSITAYLDLLERRTSALRLLAREMAAAREAFVTLDLERIQQHTLTQENLCSEIRFLDHEIAALGETRAFAAGHEAAVARLRQAETEHAQAAGAVARHNRVQGALLRRSRRSVNALMNLLAKFSATYAAPRASRLPRLPGRA